jgi:hypothetical protein
MWFKYSKKMKHLLFTVLVLFIFTGLTAQIKSIKKSPVLTEASPENVGVSADRLARIDKMCAEAIQSGDLPGIVSMVVQKRQNRTLEGLRNGRCSGRKSHETR